MPKPRQRTAPKHFGNVCVGELYVAKFTKFPGAQLARFARLLGKAERDARHWGDAAARIPTREKLVGCRDAGEEGSYDGWPS